MNHLYLSNLLDPECEKDIMEGEVSDQAIFKAVMELHEEGTAPDDDDDMPPQPSCSKVLIAALTLTQYVAEINEPFA